MPAGAVFDAYLSPAAPVAVGGFAGVAAVGDEVAATGAVADGKAWLGGLEAEATRLLASGQPDVWDTLMHRVETQLIQAALAATRGRRIEAAQKLGIGRNTITRKIQELGIDAARD